MFLRFIRFFLISPWVAELLSSYVERRDFVRCLFAEFFLIGPLRFTEGAVIRSWVSPPLTFLVHLFLRVFAPFLRRKTSV